MSATKAPSNALPNLWDANKVKQMDDADVLVYASNLLGLDPRITNYGGGNTSVKTQMVDPLTGDGVRVLWVKGSGGDLGTAKRDGFASLYQERLLALEKIYRERSLHEDDVVALYEHCVFNLNPRACSIDTPLHSYVPFNAVSHMHADAVISIAACKDSIALTKEIWKGEMGYLPWKRPGFELGLMLRDLIKANPKIKGALMGSHGFINWAETWEECYADTLRFINLAQEYIDVKTSQHPFGPQVGATKTKDDALIKLLPKLRGMVAHEGRRLVANVDTSEEVLDFLSREERDRLAALGTSCPDHFLRTKIRPLVLTDESEIAEKLEEFRRGYAAYYGRCKHADSPPMRNPNPSVVLVPGAGMVSFGKNPSEARVTGEFYRNAIRVMKGAEAVSQYVALDEQEAFNIEYWLLEEAKLKRQPPEKELSRQVALVSGAAQGIGLATCKKLASLGACVVMLDINAEKLDQAKQEVSKAAGSVENVLSVTADVTNKTALHSAFTQSIERFGGLDIVVVNAGNARRGTVADTSDKDYEFLRDLLVDAYFQTMAEACRLMIEQGTGGSIVVVGSKNGTAVGSNAALYSAAKAFELHLMRCTATDMAKHGIRCNAVNPDAVVIGSGIWNDAWRQQTAKSLGIEPDQIENYYRDRTLLKTHVRPEDIAEAVVWLASEARSSRTTGCTITVDGGNREGFVR